jgi:ELWxxDGT repeat protein
LYFSANDGTHGKELWSSDGTEDGTALVEDVYEGINQGDPTYLTSFNNTLYFSGQSIDGYELWVLGASTQQPETTPTEDLTEEENPIIVTETTNEDDNEITHVYITTAQDSQRDTSTEASDKSTDKFPVDVESNEVIKTPDGEMEEKGSSSIAWLFIAGSGVLLLLFLITLYVIKRKPEKSIEEF